MNGDQRPEAGFKIEAEFSVTPVISDHAVLQRYKTILVRGSGRAGAEVRAELIREIKLNQDCSGDNVEKQGVVSEDGTWCLKLPPLPAGGPYRLLCVSDGQKLKFSDIYIGDVWLLSGQSNMQLPMERVKYRFPQEYREGGSPLIRQFNVPIRWNFEAAESELPGGEWVTAAPEFTPRFSAVGFFFAQKLFARYHVPVGLLLTAVGGTPVQAWMSREALQDFPDDINSADRCRAEGYVKHIQENDDARIAAWWKKLDHYDIGLKENWVKKSESGSWRKIDLTNDWENREGLDAPGAVWFRKSLEIPEERAGKPVRLSLGTITDADFTYVNGKMAGNISYQYPPREYELPGLPSGTTTIVLRVVAVHGQGGFTPGKEHRLIWEDGVIYPISKDWEYCRGAVMEPLEEQTFFERKPLGMYQGMIAPLHDFPIKGVCWYQGEMNADEYSIYGKYFKNMIQDWRKKWKHESMPVLFVQLPNYDLPDAGNWVQFREVQRELSTIPDTAMVVSVDCGEVNDLHPTNKKPIGERLAMAAFEKAYKEAGTWLSPVFAYGERRRDEIILYFTHAKAGLGSIDGKNLDGFELCFESVDPDGRIVYEKIWAKAQTEGRTVVVTCPSLPGKVLKTLGYAWSNNPVNANLCNRSKLPASPFLYRV